MTLSQYLVCMKLIKITFFLIKKSNDIFLFNDPSFPNKRKKHILTRVTFTFTVSSKQTQRELAQKVFKNTYLSLIKESKKKLSNWMKEKELNTPHAYPFLVELANHYNEKHGYPKRYEIP